MRDYTPQAEALFTQFARRHDLKFIVGIEPPVEVLWEFPEQDGLSTPLVLALQNNDELSFGVGDFWSYFFPFPRVAQDFERLLDAWVIGEARVISTRWGLSLQLKGSGDWETIYRACRIFPTLGPLNEAVQNIPTLKGSVAED